MNKKSKKYKREIINGKAFIKIKYYKKDVWVKWSSKLENTQNNIRDYRKHQRTNKKIYVPTKKDERLVYFKTEKLVDKYTGDVYYAKYRNNYDRAKVIANIENGVLNNSKSSGRSKINLKEDTEMEIKEKVYITKLAEYVQ